jgi:hypothetical protein
VCIDDTLDLTALEVDPNLDATHQVRFFALAQGSETPPEGTDVLATGFPRDIARETKPGAVVVFYHTEWTEVARNREGLKGFDPKMHFLAPYHTAQGFAGANPTGLSGSGVWFHKPTPEVWHPNIDLAGVMLSWYAGSRFLKVIRRETIETFLFAHFGHG